MNNVGIAALHGDFFEQPLYMQCLTSFQHTSRTGTRISQYLILTCTMVRTSPYLESSLLTQYRQRDAGNRAAAQPSDDGREAAAYLLREHA